MNSIPQQRFRRAAGIAAAAILLAQSSATVWAQAPASRVIADIDLAKVFGARSPWRFVARQEPDGPDPIFPDQTAPGKIHLCLEDGAPPACTVPLAPMPERPGSPPDDLWGAARYLRSAQVVHPHGPSRAPLLLMQTASVHAVDGGQIVFTQAFAYRPETNTFTRVYRFDTGTNNNEEVRYIASGPLAGAIISAVPTEHAPFGFWITVNRPADDDAYRRVLRYHSATGYNDGDALAVIDSEMPNIQRRLGLWRPGQPLPLPAKSCPKPHLKHMELWCS